MTTLNTSGLHQTIYGVEVREYIARSMEAVIEMVRLGIERMKELASGCMKPCRNGVINKKEAVRMLFLEYLQCSACQKAKKWLDEHQISCEDRHIMENNPTSDQMRIGA